VPAVDGPAGVVAVPGCGRDECGRRVDIDLVDGVEAFDARRIWWFLYDGIDGGLTTEDLLAACAATLSPAGPYTAKAETLTGTVTWSNQQTQLIAFDADGVKRGRLDGDTFYSVIPDNWQNPAGTYHGTGEYPTCLAGEKDSPVSMDRHRVRIEVVHRDTGGRQPQHIAVHVHCLD